MLTYILSNGMLAAGNLEESLFYAGKFYETVEDMEGSWSITDDQDNELEIVGMLKEFDGYTTAIYAANEHENDIIEEHISVSEGEMYPAYWCFNDMVFFLDVQEVDGRGHYWTYLSDDFKNGFNTLEEAKQWANTK